MKSIKYIIALFLIIHFCFPLCGEKRMARKSMAELTDPYSPSYVPFPYPKNRQEILADLKYYIVTYCSGTNPEIETASLDSSPSSNDIISRGIIKPNPRYKIDKILKIKNRIASYPDDYHWLIHIMDENGNIAMATSYTASGLFMGSGAIVDNELKSCTPKRRNKLERLRKLHSDDDIIHILSESIGSAFNENDIKKMDRVAYSHSIGDHLDPLWEVEMTDGTMFYYSIMRDMVYSIDRKITWGKNKLGYREFNSSMVPHRDFLPDTVGDQLIILKKIPRK
ncbi:MAG: hypothetical protein GY757_04775 [bacterium]|nr:hypothetical protein [bacterium]